MIYIYISFFHFLIAVPSIKNFVKTSMASQWLLFHEKFNIIFFFQLKKKNKELIIIMMYQKNSILKKLPNNIKYNFYIK